ncbi:unnamed protein product [Microthlaspi erraticum]|uniref:pyruvate dehydrogenase (acetyl-transferring) n=1 Tax=Microthlaspi erraticum TaxID=1685480 RepID=A0A6D2KXT2_9BRAS|nr:unnamed protein product [Microthlaspi erraticum]CAA7058110.1 unnamed protein product [Microthlaspi erraticum]
MSAILQGAGTATALLPSNSIDCNRLVAPCCSSLSGSLSSSFVFEFGVRSKRYIVAGSDGIKSLTSGLKARRSEPLIVNAVATKADNAASSITSKSGYILHLLVLDTLCQGGGSYKVTKGLADKFGDLRVLDTPICENAFTGMGIGAAMTGLRPVIEGMNMGFLLLAFNQISNNCGMLHYTSGGQFTIPVVIRGPGGVGRQLGAEHSQRLESYFQSIPRIQMVACSTP